MKVMILITTPPGSDNRLCTLTLETVRVGFPTASIHIHLNTRPPISPFAVNRATERNGEWMWTYVWTHHYDWIYRMIWVDMDEPLIILDGDIIFYESVEDFKPFTQSLIAGHYIPEHLNIFSKCVSAARLHSSFLWIPSPKKLMAAITSFYSDRSEKERDYLLLDFISPRVSFINGQAIFHDTGANLYNAIGGEHFQPDMLDRFFHINSACFYKEVMACLSPEEQAQYEHIHKLAKNPETRRMLRGAWRATDNFYRSKRITNPLT